MLQRNVGPLLACRRVADGPLPVSARPGDLVLVALSCIEYQRLG
jgi:hypothetical protein